jgi:hypothetical protein
MGEGEQPQPGRPVPCNPQLMPLLSRLSVLVPLASLPCLTAIALGSALGCSSGASATTSDGGPGPLTLTRPVQMNDVSILLPLATTERDFDAYTKADALVPKGLFAAFNVPGKTAVGTGTPKLDYASLKLIAVRIDPCFATIGPVKDASLCQNQMRLIMQALTFSNGATTAEDTALHLFYSLSRSELVEVANAITALRANNAGAEGGAGDLGPLAVHPTIAKQGVAGAMSTGLSTLVRAHASPANLIRMTRMYSSSDFWDFNGVDIQNGAAKEMTIPTIPNAGTVVSIIEPVTLNNFNGTFTPSPTTQDDIQVLTSVARGSAASAADRQAAFDAMLRIENPNFHSPNTIDCASCHVSEVARVNNAPLWGLTAEGDAFSFARPASVPAADLALTAPVEPGRSNKNFHAFSYKGLEPRINQRVVNETAAVVDYLNALGK